jgi:hypothetical protein
MKFLKWLSFINLSSCTHLQGRGKIFVVVVWPPHGEKFLKWFSFINLSSCTNLQGRGKKKMRDGLQGGKEIMHKKKTPMIN